ncbi:MAG: IS91 family transposase [Deltaproteobacteria bacterium]
MPPTRKRPAVEVGDIFRAHGAVYRQEHVLTPDQLKVMRAIETCRTEVLGGHLDVCDGCGFERPSYNSCRDRHCPKCQSLTQAKWIEQRLERLLPTHYFHVVFTVPAVLRPVCRRNQREMYKLLFEAATKTLLTIAADPEHLGAQPGITCVLHTWTRALDYHPHLHCIVTGGGLSPDGTSWVPARGQYLFPVKVLSALYRGIFLDALKRAHQRGEVHFDDAELRALIDRLYQHPWVVYAKRPFGGPEQVFKYLGRYTHRVGISNQRIRSMDEGGVCFATKGGDAVTITPQEFIRRFLLHVLPPGFTKIRHYGLWASGRTAARLDLSRQLLAAAPAEPPPPPPEPHPLDVEDPLDEAEPADQTDPLTHPDTWQLRLLRLTGIDVTRCPQCGQGRMIAQPLPAADPTIDGADTS